MMQEVFVHNRDEDMNCYKEMVEQQELNILYYTMIVLLLLLLSINKSMYKLFENNK